MKKLDDAHNELKAYVAVYYHFPDKYKVEFRGLLNWTKYIRKKIKYGTFPENLRHLFEELEASRSDEHTGEKKEESVSNGKCGKK